LQKTRNSRLSKYIASDSRLIINDSTCRKNKCLNYTSNYIKFTVRRRRRRLKKESEQVNA